MHTGRIDKIQRMRSLSTYSLLKARPSARFIMGTAEERELLSFLFFFSCECRLVLSDNGPRLGFPTRLLLAGDGSAPASRNERERGVRATTARRCPTVPRWRNGGRGASTGPLAFKGIGTRWVAAQSYSVRRDAESHRRPVRGPAQLKANRFTCDDEPIVNFFPFRRVRRVPFISSIIGSFVRTLLASRRVFFSEKKENNLELYPVFNMQLNRRLSNAVAGVPGHWI